MRAHGPHESRRPDHERSEDLVRPLGSPSMTRSIARPESPVPDEELSRPSFFERSLSQIGVSNLRLVSRAPESNVDAKKTHADPQIAGSCGDDASPLGARAEVVEFLANAVVRLVLERERSPDAAAQPAGCEHGKLRREREPR